MNKLLDVRHIENTSLDLIHTVMRSGILTKTQWASERSAFLLDQPGIKVSPLTKILICRRPSVMTMPVILALARMGNVTGSPRPG